MNTNRDLSAEARSAKVDRLDESIDHVARHMVRVADADDLASKIISALPERVTWFGWLTHSWVPRLAMIAVVVASGIVWGNRREVSTPGTSPLASSQAIVAPTALVASVKEAAPSRTTTLEPLELLAPLEPERVDHERSLPAISAVASLEFDSLATVSLPEDAPLTLAPLAIADLPLTAESISPR